MLDTDVSQATAWSEFRSRLDEVDDTERDELLAARARGLGILLISADLEEILALADRIGVLVRGRLVGEVPRDEATPERLGRLMLAGGETA